MGRVPGALTRRHPAPRALTAVVVALAGRAAAWTGSYLIIGEGAPREVMASRVPEGIFQAGPSLAVTISSWNLPFGVGSIVLGSMFAIGRISLGYFAPWWRAIGHRVALGSNSFVLTAPGKLAPDPSVLWQRIGAREILADVLVAAALANIRMWRPRHWRDMKLARVRAVADVRLRATEVARLAAAFALLAWTANIEAAGVAAFLSRLAD
ncbi:MAG: hypothetical protein FJ028_09140 [Chloroflexi bacterium]|nr:hypothetical protein [Chloroflexota bacterium]